MKIEDQRKKDPLVRVADIASGDMFLTKGGTYYIRITTGLFTRASCVQLPGWGLVDMNLMEYVHPVNAKLVIE